VLPLLRPSYCLTLLPDSVTLTQQRRAWPLARWQRGLTHVVAPIAKSEASIAAHALPDGALDQDAMAAGPSPDRATEQGYQPWHGALQAGLSQLKELPPGSQLTVVLSNQWLRYKLLPAMPPLQSHSASLAIARTWFMETYGEAATTWHIALEPLPQGDQQFACALDQALLTAIRAMATQAGCQLVSVQPAMMHLYNLLYRQLGRALCALVQVEAGRIHLAMMRDGGWLGLSACASQAKDWPQQLLALLQRESLLLGDSVLPTGKLFVHLALPETHAAAWPAFERAASDMGWQAVPVFPQVSSVSVMASPVQAWAGS
jgi:hypothetical protein